MHENVVTPVRMLLHETYASFVLMSFLPDRRELYHNHHLKGNREHERFDQAHGTQPGTACKTPTTACKTRRAQKTGNEPSLNRKRLQGPKLSVEKE